MRKIEAIKLKASAVKTDGISTNLRKWLEDHSSGLKRDASTGANETDKTIYLLSFHDDGVVWGKLKEENSASKLLTSDALKNSKGNSFPSPVFRVETLQECRLFSNNGELYVWRNSNNFKARLIEDSNNAPDDDKKNEFFDESQVLWGRGIAKRDSSKIAKAGEEFWQTEDFSVVSDGDEGLLHAFPKVVEAEKFALEKSKEGEIIKRQRPLRLRVRHYLDYDEDGCAYISLSRLVDVGVE